MVESSSQNDGVGHNYGVLEMKKLCSFLVKLEYIGPNSVRVALYREEYKPRHQPVH